MKLFKHYYGKKGLMIEALKPARGVEKRYRDSFRQEPFSRLESRRNVSNPAFLLQLARTGDQDAYIDLIEHLATEIQRHALHNRWKVDKAGGRAMGLAMVALWPYLKGRGKLPSDQNAAQMMGVAKSTYQESWKDRMQIFTRWVAGWAGELESR